MELIDFVKTALKKTTEREIKTNAWKIHVKSFEDLKNENYNIETAWNELSMRYSEVMSDIRMIKDFIKTWETLEK